VSANLDLVRSIYAAWERGDFTSVAWADPAIELVFTDGPSPGAWTGLAGMAEGWRSWLSAWDEWRSEPDEFRELDDAQVLVLDHVRGRGKASGLDLGRMGAKGAQLYDLRDGKVTRIVVYFDRERARAPTSGSVRRLAPRDRVAEPRPRALDVCALGTWRLELDRLPRGPAQRPARPTKRRPAKKRR
jgi:ketosteroid isomerase-like protein